MFWSQMEDAILVDIRADEVRSAEGVAQLQRGAIGKGAAVPVLPLRPLLARRCTHW